MKEIHDPARLRRYLDLYQIPSLFDTAELPFRLYEYGIGEMMHLQHPAADWLKFVVDGSFDLYCVREDGMRYLLNHCQGFFFLGDLEFCGKSSGRNYQEVTQTVLTLELPLKPLQKILEQDNRFLWFLLNGLADKLSAATPLKAQFPTLEHALLYHIRHKCPSQTITSVDALTKELNYSRRQVQRVLKALTGQGLLVKTGKGVYRLRQ